MLHAIKQGLVDRRRKRSPGRSPYKYAPLPESQQSIRILSLEPGQCDNTIRCSLSQVELDACPKFEAISYVWGDATDKKHIMCNGKALEITRNLSDALLTFRSSEHSRVLWADAICIDQDNIEERNSQVQLMARIYSQASKVLVWLGFEDDATVQRSLRLICRISNQGRLEDEHDESIASYLWRGAEVDCNDDEPLQLDQTRTHADLVHVERLFSCPFFGRGWVFQEVVLSSETLFHWGQACIEFSPLGGFALSFGQGLLQLDALGDGWRGYYTLTRMYQYRRHRRTVFPTSLDHIELTSFMEFTDEKDKIYGILGLLRGNGDPLEGETFIEPDYGITTLECYTRFAEAVLLQEKEVNILTRVEKDQSLHEDWPSWVPDWCDSSVSYNITGYETSGEEPATISKSVCENPRCIVIRGIKIETVDEIMDRYDSRRKNQQILQGLRDRYDAATAALTATTGRETDREAILGKDDPRLAAHIAELEHFLSQDIGDEDEGDVVPVSRFERSYGITLYSHSLFITQAGMICLGSADAQPGDVVVILFGGTAPFLLRPVQNFWRVVGSCYVHGIMEGQAVEKWRESGEPAVDFSLI